MNRISPKIRNRICNFKNFSLLVFFMCVCLQKVFEGPESGVKDFKYKSNGPLGVTGVVWLQLRSLLADSDFGWEDIPYKTNIQINYQTCCYIMDKRLQ